MSPAEGTSSGTWQVPARGALRPLVCLYLAVMLVVTVPAGAWTVPGKSGDCTLHFGDSSSWYETSKQCQFAAQLEPAGVFVGGEEEFRTGYYPDPHVYELENAVRLFREKGYDNWALYLSSPDRFQALADGATWADAYKGRLVAHFSVRVAWEEVYSYDYDICNYAGFDQYYNSYSQDPKGKGLDSESIDLLAGFLPTFVNMISPAIVDLAGSLVGIPGLSGLLVSVDAEIRPSLEEDYPSGALQAQQHYDNAVKSYLGGMDTATGKSLLYWPKRSQEYNGLFQLGWTAHFIQDIGVIYHIHGIMSSFPPNPHNEFEDDAKGYGDPYDPNSTDYHVSAATWTLGLDYQNKTITQLARDEANAIDNANDWAAARSKNADIRKPAVQKGVRVSEQYTAAVIAKYLTDTGIPKVKQPFQGTVENMQGKPVPYAYVFYRKGKQCFEDPDTPIVCGMPAGAWNYVRADKNGFYVLDLKPSDASLVDTYLVRPVMPGYRYAGYQKGSSSEMMGATLDGKPLEYQPPWKTVAVTTNPYYEFYLAPLEADKPAPSMGYVTQVLLLAGPDALNTATADSLTKDIIAVTPESPVLRVHTTDSFQQKMLPLPETSYVEVQLANLVDLNTPQILQSPSMIQSAVLTAKDEEVNWYAVHEPEMISAVPPTGSAALKYQFTGPDRFVPASTPESWQMVLLSLPKTPVKAPNATMIEVPDLTFAFGTSSVFSGGFLPAMGMARVPAHNAQVEVTLEDAPGYIGPGFTDLYPGTAVLKTAVPLSAAGPGQPDPTWAQPTQPGCIYTEGSGGCGDGSGGLPAGVQQPDPVKKIIVLTTDSTGRAALVFQTGNQAGRVRMHFRVISNPDAPGVLPEKSVDLTVHPLVNAPDPASALQPVIQAVKPRVPVLLETGGTVSTAAGPEKPAEVCLNITMDRSATVVPCPEKPVTLKIIDFISSVTSAIGKIPESVWPSSAIEPAPVEQPPCDDGNACTVMDRVVRGSCSGDQIICTPPGDDVPGRCDPATGCVYEPAAVSPDRLPVTLPAEMITGRPLLTRQPTPVPEEPGPAVEGPCDDGNACTTDDMIMDGACHGRPLICEDGDEMTADDCDPRSGCVFTRVEREPEVPEAPVTPVVVEVVTTVVPVQCPEGCSCLTQDEAKELFGRFLPCSDTPCGALVSRTGTVPRYCLRPAG